MKSIYQLMSLIILPVYVSAQNIAPQPIPYCEQIEGSNIANYSGEQLGAFCYNISDSDPAPTNIYLSSPQGLSLKPSSNVRIHAETHIKPTGNSQFTAKIVDPGISSVWYEPNGMSGTALLNRTMELGFQVEELKDYIDSGFLNPFDPDVLDLQIETTAPNGLTKTQYGFYYRPFKKSDTADVWMEDSTSFPWRFRYAPDQEGNWTFKVKLIAHFNGEVKEFKVNHQINCIWSPHKGRLITEPNKKYLKYSSNGESFFAVGMNVASAGPHQLTPLKLDKQINGLNQLVGVGANYTRLELGAWGALPDWPDVYANTTSPPNMDNYTERLDDMYAFDKVINLCEDESIYYTIFRHHVEVLDDHDNTTLWNAISWNRNPYVNHYGLNNYSEYFTNPQVNEHQLKTLRYICARWGYNSNFAFYGYSEVEKWINYKPVDGNVFLNWVNTQKNYVKSALGYDFGWTSSFGPKYKNLGTATEKVIMDQFEMDLHTKHNDVVHQHVYGETKSVNYHNRFQSSQGVNQYGVINTQKINRPILIDEMGANNGKTKIHCCSKLDYHNSIWSTAMMGSYGAGLDWWWDKGILDFGYHEDLGDLMAFFEGEDLFYGDYKPKQWKDALLEKNRVKENYYLLRGDKTRVLGWVNNATYYWRNDGLEIGGCVDNLVNLGKPGAPCITIDGDQNAGADSPYVITIEGNLGFSTPLVTTAEVHGLKPSILNSKYYLIELHKTSTPGLPETNGFSSSIVKTNVVGTVFFKWYFQGESHDIAYKISYLEDHEGLFEGEEIDTIVDFTNIHGSDKSQVSALQDLDNISIRMSKLHLYPNPTAGSVSLSSDLQSIGEIVVTDVYGNKLLNFFIKEKSGTINLSNYSNGMYFIKHKQNIYRILKISG